MLEHIHLVHLIKHQLPVLVEQARWRFISMVASYSPMSWTTSGDQGAVVMQYGAKIDGSGLYTDKITATSGTGTITGTWNLASGSKNSSNL